jgi:SAM-dependent methyltransferase
MIPPLVRQLLSLAVGLGLSTLMIRQCRKPSFGFGRVFVAIMNLSHAALTAWGLGHVRVQRYFTILDIGCGGGRTIAKLAELAPDGSVFGIDHSETSIAAARRTNAHAVERGKVQLSAGSVSRLPFPAAMFDLVTAIETHYYWRDFPSDLREVLRVIKPGGTLVLIAETYRGRSDDWLLRPTMKLLGGSVYLTSDEHRAALSEAGFVDVSVSVEPAHGWISARGSKPA